MILLLSVLTLMASCELSALRNMKVAYSWTYPDFTYPSETARQQAIDSGQFNPIKNVINGVDVWKTGNGTQKVFVSISKLAAGCPVTLSTVTNQTRNGVTLLKPYPDWNSQGKADGLMSVYRTRVDECDRLWVLDSCMFEDTQRICDPKIVVFDLKTDKVIRKYILPSGLVSCNSNFVNIIVDIRGGNCSGSFAYIIDVAGYKIIVYDMAKNTSWAITNNHFYPNPFYGVFKISGTEVNFMDGVLAFALGPVQNNNRPLYFHALAGVHEGWVKTSIIRNASLFVNDTGASRESFHISKNKRKSQCSLQDMTKSGIMFFGMPAENSIGCWNSKYPFNEIFMERPEKNKSAIVYISDLKVINDTEVWAISNPLQKVYYSTLPANETNYHIIFGKVRDLVKNTKCDPRWSPKIPIFP